MTNAVSALECVLVKDAAFVVFLPVLVIHRVVADELELSEAVVAVVGPCGRVDDELLACLWVRELLGSFVGAEANVFCPAVRRLLPGVCRHAENLAFREV